MSGTSLSIEKSYLRLTSAPDPKTVRPLRILMMSLDNVKAKWKTDEDYIFALDQLKAIRQDLGTLQSIKEFWSSVVLYN